MAARGELAAATGLSRSAVAAGVADLLATGLVRQRVADPGPTSGRGRPSTVLCASHPSGYVAGLDIGHMHVRAALANANGLVLAERVEDLDVDQQPDLALNRAVDLIDQLLLASDLEREDLLVVGAALPGPLDRGGPVTHSASPASASPASVPPAWTDQAATELSHRLGTPVYVENDADMGAIGEKRFGLALDYANFLYVKASHGIGASVVIDGHCYQGAHGLVGEIGHTQLAGATKRCRCGNQGCLEAVVSVSEIRDQLANTYLRHDKTGTATSLTVAAGDPVGARILAHAGRTVGRVIADGCNWLNPEAVILGGELGLSGPPFVGGVRESVDRYAQPTIALTVNVHVAGLGARSEIMGAIAVAIDHCEAP